jgi:hypothetical protein
LAEYFPQTATIEIERKKQRRPAQKAGLFLFRIKTLQITSAK